MEITARPMLILPASLTTRDARDAQRMLLQALQQGVQKKPSGTSGDGVVTVDASGLKQFDSAVLAVLLECQRLARGWGQGFSVRHAPPKLLELTRLYGIEELLLPQDASVPDAESTR